MTGLITLLSGLLQAYHQGRIGTSKTKSTGYPVPAPIALLPEFFRFALADIFSVLAGACSQAKTLLDISSRYQDSLVFPYISLYFEHTNRHAACIGAL